VKFMGNYADNGGTIYSTEGSVINITKSHFGRNYARSSGGVISV
jgi:predicted outer membrane repeat protein